MTRPTGASPGAALHDLRTAAGLSQQEVAERLNSLAARGGRGALGASANTVSRWERGVVRPTPIYRRLLAELYGVSVDDLGLATPRDQGGPAAGTPVSFADPGNRLDPRMAQSHEAWRRTRRHLNAHRPALTALAATLYDPGLRIEGTGLLARPDWVPPTPVDLGAIQLKYRAEVAPPELDGTEPESGNVRPRATLVRPYQRYTQAIRDLDHPRLFDNRASWRLVDLTWTGDGGQMAFGPSSYFAGVDIYEALAHEMAYVHPDHTGTLAAAGATLRDLPFRKLVGDPFNVARRPVLPAISTLTVRRDCRSASFILHRRDPRSVAVAGGMLQVIPSGIFQPSSVLPEAVTRDFDLWRNIMREYAEELLGKPEHDGDGRPVDYTSEPFAALDQARAAGHIRVSCLGVALDALTLVGEILTVAVIDADVFDRMAAEFVEVNDEGTVLNERVPFTSAAISRLLSRGDLAPAGAGCVALAWRHRGILLADR